MRLYLDTSVLLAACNSAAGGSRFVVDAASVNEWTLLCSRYAIIEVVRNLAKLGPGARRAWSSIQALLRLVSDVYVIDQPSVFNAVKDRPILFTAYKHADILLTLDRRDFMQAIGTRFYRLEILTPEQFIRRQRERRTIFSP